MNGFIDYQVIPIYVYSKSGQKMNKLLVSHFAKKSVIQIKIICN